jgi:hypothetical protein
MSNTTKKITRKGSGRTKGSFSFVKIPLADLAAKFADNTTPVLVSRKWAESVGFQGLTSNPVGALTNSIQGQTPETKVATKIVNLDDE